MHNVNVQRRETKIKSTVRNILVICDFSYTLSVYNPQSVYTKVHAHTIA